MKKIALLLVFLFITTVSYSKENYVPSQIKKVTVFRSGAQVYRTAHFNIPKGESTIYLDGLTRQLDQNSLQVGGKGDFSIVSMSFIQNYNYEEVKSDLYSTLEQKLEDIQFDENMHRDEISVLSEEESLILTNKKVGTKEGTDIQQLMLMAKFYRERLLEIKRHKQQLNKKLSQLGKDRSKINNQIQEIRTKNTKSSTGVIVIDITADMATTATIEMNYLVYSASWITTYDLRVKDINSPIDLLSKAMVTQSSGEDWKNVEIKISTGNPRRSSTLPTIGTWYLDYVNPYNGYSNQPAPIPIDGIAVSNMRIGQSRKKYEDSDVEYEEKMIAAVSSENLTSMEFAITKKVSIPSDGKKHEIKLEHQDLKADFEYLTIPKRDKAAFLLAKIPDWHDYKLMNGEANLYFEGTYVGKSIINPAQVSDTLDISLGVDIAVTVEYKRVKKETKKKFMSSKIHKQIGWEIAIKNGKGQDINITVFDQIPVSTQTDIEIDLIDKSNGKLTKETGIVEWKTKVQSGKQEKFKLVYNVKYPKKKQVALNY